MDSVNIPDYTHMLVECGGCSLVRLNDPQAISELLQAAADACALRVVDRGMHAFSPQGLTGYVLLEESHISIHTWPERGFALLDLLSCRPVDQRALIETVVNGLGATEACVRPAGRRSSAQPAESAGRVPDR